MHVEFAHYFPEIAKAQTRSLSFSQNNPYGFPGGIYLLKDLYCVDRGCDCKSVYISVVNEQGESLAMINYGWAPLKFYIRWLRGDEQMAKLFKGPSLEGAMTRQSAYAPKFLKIFKDIIKKDKAYENRLKSHYALVKDIIG